MTAASIPWDSEPCRHQGSEGSSPRKGNEMDPAAVRAICIERDCVRSGVTRRDLVAHKVLQSTAHALTSPAGTSEEMFA